MPILRRTLGVVFVTALVIATFSSTATATMTQTPPVPRPKPPVMAAGIIVTTAGSAPSSAMLRKTESVLGDDNGVAKVLRRGGNTSVLFTSNRLSGAEARSVATQLEQRPDVVSASPNYIRHTYGNSPVVTNDTYFSRLKQIWDSRGRADSRVKSVLGSSNSFPNGGYSSKAPALWKSTKGSGQVVAVVDTGITDHPELNDQVLPGYDFVSQYYDDGVGLVDTGRDGDGRDDDPHDMGDWGPAGYCYEDSPAENSSWHGTHVSGIVAAQRDNGQGIVGVAPSAKILPVRVLGLCGGTDLDIADGIRWAAGLNVAGTPTNANPADVINLSLGGPGTCSASSFLGAAITAARSAGSVVVAAAGNDGANIDSEPTSPATCAGVISVGSTSEYGDLAGYRFRGKKEIYSNYGRSLDISAPGGDTFWDDRSILSTINKGTRSPGAPGYAEHDGTSMAAPVVAAGAALIRSLAPFTPAQTEAALKAAVAAFPTGKSSFFKACTTAICGKGIIDLSKVVAPVSAAKISGSLAVNETLTATRGTWTVTPTTLAYQWLRNGAAISGATASTYTVRAADVGATIAVRIRPASGPFAPVTTTATTAPSNATVPQGPALTLTGLPSSTTYGVRAAATVRVGTQAAPIDGRVELRRGSTVIASGTTVNGLVNLTVSGTSWVGGANPIRAAFLGNGSVGASSTPSSSVTVAKATPTIAFKLPSTVKSKKRASVTVTITAPGVPTVTGYFRVLDGKKKLGTWALVAKNKGKRTVTLPKITKKARHKITVVYVGTSTVAGRTSSSKTLKVK